MENNTIIWFVVFLSGLGFCIWGISTINVKPFEPSVLLEPCECVSECLQDYEKFGTFNYFTYVSHKSWSFERRTCQSINATVKATCYREI